MSQAALTPVYGHLHGCFQHIPLDQNLQYQHRVVRLSVVIAFSLLSFALGSEAVADSFDDAKVWSKTSKPSRQPAQAIGRYSAGCLSGGIRIPKNGRGYQVMRLQRNRVYGHPSLVKFIKKLGRQVASNELGVVMVGDLALPRGGPTLANHVSHQNGLDVDLWFYTPPEAAKRRLSKREREKIWARSVLSSDKSEMNHEIWGEHNADILRLAAQAPEVQRILVNPRIKQELCETETDKSWLHKLRPWWGHADHYHVRLACPKGAPHCVRQAKTSKASGCGNLQRWLSKQQHNEKEKAEIRAMEIATGTKQESAPRAAPTLPKVCKRVIGARSKRR